MALSKTKLKLDLITAFYSITWAEAATLFTTAIDNYFLSATATITVNGIVTPPLPASPYPAEGVGTGYPVTIEAGVAGLNSACISAFALPEWKLLSAIISPQIANLITTSTLTTTVTGVLQGTGTLISWVATGTTALESAINLAFTTSFSWSEVATKISDAIEAFLKTVTFSTSDTGIIPVVSWVGTGVNGILS